MAGMRFDPVPGCECSHICNPAQFFGPGFACKMRIMAGVKLDDGRTQLNSRFNLHRIRFDKQADTDIGAGKFGYEWHQMVIAASSIKATFGCSLFPFFGYDAGRMGGVVQGDCQHIIGCCQFEIERNFERSAQPVYIVIGDMAPILAQMGGDAVRSGLGGVCGRAHRIRMAAAARVSDRGDMIDIDT